MTEVFVPKHLHFKISESKKAEGHLCCAYHCRNKPGKKKRGLCYKHYHVYRRILDPVYDRYVNFKRNALKRSKDFRITLQEFRDWCNETGYIVKKGMRGKNCTVDRIRNWEGYYIGNLQLKTNAANIAKYHNHDKHITELPADHEDHVPF